MGGCTSSTFPRRVKVRLEKHFARRVPDAHGGGISPDGTFMYGYSSTQASRLKMEDYFDIHTAEINESSFGYFAVYDGHTGKRAAEYLRDNLFNNIVSHPQFVSDTQWALVDAFDRTDDDLLDSIGDREDGSTASVIVLFKDRLVVAHVGDSRVVISRKNQNGSHRPLGRLGVSRAFGNKHLKLYIPADPDTHEEPVDETLDCIIIASDGLWVALSNQEAVDIVMRENDVQEAASELMRKAQAINDFDNITCIVVKFNH
ncbi:hypothetical protein LUZ60_017483 [Juncus effusus]|nr:hypothetical protein LUZ60_017483 [Juncus effusus]